MEAVAQRLAVHRPLLPPDSARRAPGLFQALQGVAVELQQVVGGGDQAPLRLGGRQPPAFEAVDAVMGSRRRIPLSTRAVAALDSLPPRLDTPLLFPAVRGGHIGLDTWRTREWYPALDAAGLRRRGPYQLRHTFATEALAAGISIFELARVMDASVKTIDKHYGHLARDSEQAIRARLDARADTTPTTVGSGDA